jgi:hypothetical protein
MPLTPRVAVHLHLLLFPMLLRAVPFTGSTKRHPASGPQEPLPAGAAPVPAASHTHTTLRHHTCVVGLDAADTASCCASAPAAA